MVTLGVMIRRDLRGWTRRLEPFRFRLGVIRMLG